jgi:cyclic-di-GMP phosphodiesterase TipF (flagellum assembly factor)
MRKLTVALLGGAYLCLALIAGLVAWRTGGGAGGGLAGGLAAFGLCLALQNLVARLFETSGLAAEIDHLRQAHLILASEIETMETRVGEMVEGARAEAQRQADQIYAEVRLIEDVLQAIGERLEAEPLTAPAPPVVASPAPQAAALMETVRSALEAGRVDLYLQAVVSLPQRRTQFYESFSRLRDETGRVLMPAEFMSVAEPGGLAPAIDNLLLVRCVQIVRRLARQARKVGIFCNISLASLGDEAFFPSFLEFLTPNRDLASQLIFELGQAPFDARNALQARNMAKLADLGFRFSLDKVGDLDLDFQELARSDVAFVKIAAPLLLDELAEADGQLVLKSAPDLAATDLSALARRHGVELIAEKVESERQVVDILDLDIALGQGHLFGEPRPIRDAVLAETDAPARVIQAALRRRTG